MSAGRPWSFIMSTGIPEPLSFTVIDSSGLMVTSIRSQRPASASSTEFATTSYARWWRPLEPVEPMYIPGRFRTGSSPSRTVMSFALYAASAISSDRGVSLEKSLQIAYLQGDNSVSEREVGRRAGQPQRDRPRDAFSQLLVVDPGGQLVGQLQGFFVRLRHLGTALGEVW